jgi:hypothetical protein
MADGDMPERIQNALIGKDAIAERDLFFCLIQCGRHQKLSPEPLLG